jgi:hypothetical protein
VPRRDTALGGRAAGLARAAAAVVGAVLCLLGTAGLSGAAAAAVPQQPVTVTVVCIVPGSNGTYRAVFGYDSPTTKYNIPVGQSNKLIPSSLNGSQPTKFEIGAHRAAFTTPAISNSQTVTWSVYTSYEFPTSSATASSASRTCGPEVSLPAEGNGTGPVVIVAVSLVVAFLVLALRRRTATVRAE